MAKKKKGPSKFLRAMYEAYGIEPTEVKGVLNCRTDFYWTQLQKIAMSIIDIKFNEEFRWDKDYIREALLLKGYFTVTESEEGVLLPLKCGATGVNVFNRATTVVVANPVINSFNRTIGVDCELVYLQQKQGSRFRSLSPIITVFAQKLANCDAGIDINLFNSRTPFIFQAPNQQVSESFKAMYDEISQGEPATFVDESIGNLLQGSEGSNLIVLKAKENFVADVIQNEKLQILNEYLTCIGINTANTTKRERQIVDEVNANNVEIMANIKLWKQNVEECCDRVNAMFPEAQLKITFPYFKEEEISQSTDEKEVNDNEPD